MESDLISSRLKFLAFVALLIPAACSDHDGHADGHVHGARYAAWKAGPTSDPLSPKDALKSFVIQPGYKVELAASEPLVQDPVAVAFDASGRMWVAEMTGYMLDISGAGQNDPVGKIAIVSDEDRDGYYDKRQVFLDGLILPRAIAHVPGGILFADNNSLWFAENRNGSAGKPVLVDEDYATGNNVEHKPNGLLTNLDNWIYSANSRDAYRVYPAGAAIPPQSDVIFTNKHFSLAYRSTVKRGQWGISADDHGRLFYNNNSVLLIADTLRSDVPGRNPNFRFPQGHQIGLADNRVWPVRPTPGVNRGFRDNMLDEGQRLLKATAASGPVIYRGEQMPALYGHAVIPEPSGNLVTAIEVEQEEGRLVGSHMHEGAALLASTDERFRPVNIYTGPDGALYIVDMYRGIIQDQFFLTKYLADYITDKGLDQGSGMGRIYRLAPNDQEEQAMPDLSGQKGAGLVTEITHINGWRRDMARRLIIERQDMSLVPALTELAADAAQSVQVRLGALWALEGLAAIDIDVLRGAINPGMSAEMKAHVIHLAEQLDSDGQGIIAAAAEGWINSDGEDATVFGSSLASLGYSDLPDASMRLAALYQKIWKDQPFAAATVLSAQTGREETVVALVRDEAARAELEAVFALKDVDKEVLPEHLATAELAIYKRGMSKYEGAGACSGCHGEAGEGAEFAGPPLAGSEWVTGSSERLLALLLNGMTGPLHVNGTLYTVDMEMPALEDNDELGAADIAAIATFIRNSWGNQASAVTTGDVNAMRMRLKERKQSWTEAELKSEFGDD